MNSRKRPVVIAHRGACGYLPEHSFPAKALAYAMGADFLEQDVVASRDDVLVVLHDIHLDRVSDVAIKHPRRLRADGRFYVRDFDLTELRGLTFGERRNADGSAVYPRRFPVGCSDFKIHTFAEELAFIHDLNVTTGGSVGCYAEIKRPAWHRAEGLDITPAFLEILGAHGYSTRGDAAFVQCFDAAELLRVREDLNCDLRLVQLIGENAWNEGPSDFVSLRTLPGLARLARSVDAIAPWIPQLYTLRDGQPLANDLVGNAQGLGLQVHPYTFRKDELPPGFSSFSELLQFALQTLGVDGLFTDFADLARQAVDASA